MGATTSLRVQTFPLVCLAGWLGTFSSIEVRGEDAIVCSSIGDLKLEAEVLPKGEAKRPAMPAPVSWGHAAQLEEVPYVVLDGPGEAYVGAAWPQGLPAPERGATWPLTPMGRIYPDD